jgi:hypothetical protein
MGEEPLYEALQYNTPDPQRRETGQNLSFLAHPVEVEFERDDYRRYIGVESKRVEYLNDEYHSETQSEQDNSVRAVTNEISVIATPGQFEYQAPINSYPTSSEILAQKSIQNPDHQLSLSAMQALQKHPVKP